MDRCHELRLTRERIVVFLQESAGRGIQRGVGVRVDEEAGDGLVKEVRLVAVFFFARLTVGHARRGHPSMSRSTSNLSSEYPHTRRRSTPPRLDAICGS